MQSQTSNWCSYVTEATLFRQKCSDWTFEHFDVFYMVYENILKWNNCDKYLCEGRNDSLSSTFVEADYSCSLKFKLRSNLK